MTREKIAKLIEKAIKELQKKGIFPEFDIPEIHIERPEEKTHGDYATNIAMTIAKQVKKNPMEIAKLINFQFSIFNFQFFEKVEVKEPGFINFFLSKKYLQKQVEEILKQGEKFGESKVGKGQKANIEFVSANPTGLLHIGNGRGAFFGDTLSNVLEKAGYKIVREYYINDAKVNTQIRTLGQTVLGRGIIYLNDYLKSKILNLRLKLEKISDEGEAGYLLAQEVQKDIKEFIEQKLKIKFDNWVSEEDLYKKSKIVKIYLFLVKKGLVYTQHSLLSWFKTESFVPFPPEPYKVAHWLKTKEFGDLQDEVIIRETGDPTYFLSDIAYHKDKFDRGFQKIINIWGADHQGHVLKIKAAAKILGYKGDLNILISQVVRLKRGKISKRAGEIVALEDLINEVGLDVARFLYLTKSLDTQMEFDLKSAKEQSKKNPVYYIQYAYARLCSILRKAPYPSKNPSNINKYTPVYLLIHQRELELIKQLIKLSEVIEDTAKDYQVQRLPQYALDLAAVFHQFYRDCKVLTDLAEGRPLRESRLALVLATKIVLKNTLNLMGISAPEKM